jgi:hypothetical protein
VPQYPPGDPAVPRHLERLDEAVVGLARPLGVPMATPKR